MFDIYTKQDKKEEPTEKNNLIAYYTFDAIFTH
jgi:hypothetical protein